jgi:toxin HigB-1
VLLGHPPSLSAIADIINVMLNSLSYTVLSFGPKETELIFRAMVPKRLPQDIQKTARRKLLYLNDAENLRDLLASPGNRLVKLDGDRQGQYSIRINDQWRICFRWDEGQAFDVEIVDYHS